MKSTATESALRRRLFSSFLAGAVFFAAFIIAFISVKHADPIEGVPAPLRKGLDIDGKIAGAVYSPSRLSVALPSPKGQPRVNGDIGINSAFDLANYQVLVESGSRHVQIPIGDFEKLPYSKVSTVFKCVEGWSTPVEYEGYRFSDLMSAYGVGRKDDGSLYKYVGLVTPDGNYYVSIDIESMMHSQTLLVVKMNEMPISSENGAPIRLIIPIKYGIKSLKRIGRIFFSDERPPDYWHERGYDWYAGL
jgi:hypothetical protein